MKNSRILTVNNTFEIMGKFLVEGNITESNKSKESSIQNKEMKIQSNDDLQLDSYFGPELPPNILFPDQLNKYLREQIQNLSLENGSLRRSLEELQDELISTKQKLTKPPLPIAGRASEIAANKIAELSRRLREQNAEVESLRTRAKDAEAKLRQLEANPVGQEPPEPPSEGEIAEKDRQIRVLTEKLQTAYAKMCDFRNQCQALRQEMKLAQKVIESEVGDKVVWQDLAKESGGWRGRAQQIIALQNKIQHLQEQLSNTSVAETPAVNVLRQMEKDRRASYEETTKQLNQKTIQMEEMRKKLEASKARNKVLENEIVQVKTKLSSLMDKGARDEQLVTALTNQINGFEDRGKAQMQCFAKMQDNIYRLQQEVDIEKEKNEQLQKALAERENRIHRLEEQIEEFRKLKILHKDDVPVKQNETESDEPVVPPGLNSGKKAFSIVDSERMRLLELLAVVNRRLDEARREQMSAETQLRKEKVKNAKLETKVARLELERVGAIKTGRGSYSQNNGRMDPSLDDADIMARQHIEYLEEECLALKTRIETLQMEKEDDLKVFAAMADLRENLLDNKFTNHPSMKKVNSTCKLPNRRAKHNQNKIRKFSPARYSANGHSSFSSEESITQ